MPAIRISSRTEVIAPSLILTLKMKKTILTLMGLMAFGISFAQNSQNGGMFVELEPAVNVQGGSFFGKVNVGGAFHVADNFYWGLGAGFSTDANFESFGIPIFTRLIYNNRTKTVSPYISVDMGYELNTNDFSYGTVLLSPTFGVKFGNMYTGLSYIGNIATSGGGMSHGIGIKLGTMIDGKGTARALGKFFSKMTVEASYGFGLNNNVVETSHKGKISKFGRNVKLQLIENIGITECLSIGIGAGFQASLEKGVETFSGSGYEDEKLLSSLCVPVFARPQYNIRQASFGYFHPYVACDLGYRIGAGGDTGDASGLLIEPQVGITNGRFSLSVGYSVGSIKVEDAYENEKQDASSINIKLGVRL